MSKAIKPDDLQKVLNEYLKSYAEDITEDVIETTNTITKKAVKELQEVSPKGKGSRKSPYYKGWTKQKGKENKGIYTTKIHNKTNYQLTHLLEFGHATRNGRRTKAIPHIRPVEEKYNKLYSKTLTTVIRRRRSRR